MPGRDTNVGAKRARELRAELGLDPAAPLDCLLTLVESRLGIPVNLTRMQEGLEGVCWRSADEQLLWVNLHEFVPRSRFTLAHELGHVRCRHDGSMIVDTSDELAGTVRAPHEIQANAFAAELLAPRAGVTEVLGRRPVDLGVVVEIAARFGVSTLAGLFRCVTLGLVLSGSALREQIAADEHLPLWAAVDSTYEDALTAVEPTTLPRLSPVLADGGLGALLRGTASVEDVAALAGCPPETLVRALQRLGIP